MELYKVQQTINIWFIFPHGTIRVLGFCRFAWSVRVDSRPARNDVGWRLARSEHGSRGNGEVLRTCAVQLRVKQDTRKIKEQCKGFYSSSSSSSSASASASASSTSSSSSSSSSFSFASSTTAV